MAQMTSMQAILAYIIHVQKWHNGTIIIFLNL